MQMMVFMILSFNVISVRNFVCFCLNLISNDWRRLFTISDNLTLIHAVILETHTVAQRIVTLILFFTLFLIDAENALLVRVLNGQ